MEKNDIFDRMIKRMRNTLIKFQLIIWLDAWTGIEVQSDIDVANE